MKISSSHHQQRLWFIDFFEKNYLYEGSPIYHNVPLFFRIEKSVSEDELGQALETIVSRHEVLRTSLTNENGNISQIIAPISEFDFSTISSSEERLEERLEEVRKLPLDFDCLMKVYYEIDETSTSVLVVIHHAIIDRHSIKVIRKELVELLTEATTEAYTPMAYQNFSNWQNSLTEDQLEPLSFYWKSKLRDIQVLYLPTDRERDKIHVYASKSEKFRFPKKQLVEFCQNQNISPRGLFLAAYKMGLARFSGLSDIVLGTFMNPREAKSQHLLGPLENLVVLRSQLNGEKSLLDNALLVEDTWNEAALYKTMPFDKLVGEINPKKDMSRTALFDVLFAFESFEEEAMEVNTNNDGWGKYDFNLLVKEQENHFDLVLTYNELYFNAETVQSVNGLIGRILDETIEAGHKRLNEIQLVANDEKEGLIDLNTTQFVADDSTILSWFATQVKQNKNKAALSWDGGEHTYLELDEKSNKLANVLVEKLQVGLEDKVAVLLASQEQIVITLLAILKAGAAYVPINPDYPEDRKSFILKDANCKISIDEDFFDQWDISLEAASTFAPNVQVRAENLAYIIYTSGTTGQPKGVLIEHKNVISLLRSCFQQLDITSKDNWLYFHSYCFDFSVWEIFGCLLSGGNLSMVDGDDAKNAKDLSNLMNVFGTTVFSQTPSAFYNFIEVGEVVPSLRYVVFGGEALNPLKLKSWSQENPNITLVNMYGITETTVHVTIKKLTANDIESDTSNIGKPLSFAKCYILNKEQQLVPFGLPGELYISGAGVARGYLNRPELTSERFLKTNTFGVKETLYKTGDLARFMPNGDIEYLGRADDQVKIRGYRIELEEINRQLQTLDAVKQSTVKVFEHEDGDKSLVAYASGINNLSEDDVRAHLASKMPEYMVPSFVIIMDRIPLNRNGKIDKANLPSPLESIGDVKIETVAPSNDLEQSLFDIWKDILGIENFGITHNFFEIGGHSLRATRLMSSIQKNFDVKISLKDIFENPTIKEQLRFINVQEEQVYTEIPQVPQQETYPISSAQRRLWILSQLEGGSIAYNMPFQMELSGAYNIKNFKKAVHAVIDRHEILRTVFVKNETGEGRQKVLSIEELGFEIATVDFSDNSDPIAASKIYIADDSTKPFDLENGPLLRVSLLQVTHDNFIFCYNMHHIISDGWSAEVLSKDIMAFYNAFNNEVTPKLTDLKIQYKDYASWQLNESKSPEYKAHKDYWLNNMQGEITLVDLPSSKQRPSVKTYNGAVLQTNFDRDCTQLLNKFAQANGGSLFTCLFAAWNVLLHKYTALTDITVGSPVSGREHADLANQIGFYVNTLALRNQLNPEESFSTFHKKLHANTIASFEHQMYSFDQLVEDLNLSGDPSRSPLFDTIFTLQTKNNDTAGVNKNQRNTDEIRYTEGKTSKFDIQAVLEEVDGYLSFQLTYNTDLYEKEMAEGLVAHFKQLVGVILENPNQPIEGIDYLSVDEKSKILNDFNHTEDHFPKHATVIELFRNEVEKNPDQIAIVYENQELTYLELELLSNQFAYYLLINYDIFKNDLIGIKIDRSQWSVISMLAILKIGAAYVPIDLEYPVERIDYMESDSKCKITIDTEMLAHFKENQLDYPASAPELTLSQSALAYLMYTSGSTGQPKGVMIGQQAIIRLVKDPNFVSVPRKSVVLGLSNFSFDGSTFDIYGALLNGATLVIAPKDIFLDLDALNTMITNYKVDAFFLTTVFFNAITDANLESLNRLSYIMFGGEQVSTSHVRKFREQYPSVQLHHVYGPTENTTFSTFYAVDKIDDDVKTIPIGGPISGSECLVLDKNKNIVPVGVTGEIYLGGIGLALGYYGKETLTNEKFVDHPFMEDERLYRTGDLGRWNSQGKIEFMGRTDDQIKIRGHRIELGEIEHVIQANDAISEVVVLAEQVTDSEKEIVAYYVSQKNVSANDLKENLQQRLPAYMIPSVYMQVDSIPLTTNGKVDKRALMTLDKSGVRSEAQYLEATTETEHKLVELWQDILNIEPIGIVDDFFELGGNSLKLLTIINEFHKKFDYKITMKEIFSYRTIREQAVLIDNSKKDTYLEIECAEESLNYPISVTQKRLLLLSHIAESSVAYNMPTSIVLKDLKDIESFNKAVYDVIERHEILRTIFKEDEHGVNKQWILKTEDLDFKVELEDFRHAQNINEQVNAYINKDSYQPFDLINGPLLRASLLRISDSDYIFYYNMHHIISDGWSIEVLSKDVMAFYNGYLTNTKPNLPELRIQYKDYALWQLNRFKNNEVDISKLYWINQFSGDVPKLDLSFSKKRPKMKTFKGNIITRKLSKDSFNKLHELSSETGTTLFMNLMCMLGILLNRYSYQNDFIIGSPVVARTNAELRDQIGFYVNTLIYKISVNPKQSYVEMLNNFKNTVLDNFEYREYPFDLLVEDLGQGKDFTRNPFFDVMLVLNESDTSTGLKTESSSNIKFKDQSIKSKFDMSFTINTDKDAMNLNVIYNCDLFEKDDVDEMLTDYITLLDAVVSNHALSVNDCLNTMIKQEELQEHDSFFMEAMKSMNGEF